MFDANQHWNLPDAQRICGQLARFKPLWIEEPTHPDDVYAHQVLSREIAPVKLAAGEHIPNRVLFKNFLHLACLLCPTWETWANCTSTWFCSITSLSIMNWFFSNTFLTSRSILLFLLR